jgi:hypothetical protein
LEAPVHVTLSRWFNVAVAIMWALLLALLLKTTRPFPATEVVVGCVLGLAAGLLQVRAISTRLGDFLATQTARAVRRALVGIPEGRASVLLFWVNCVGLLIWAMAFAPDMFVGAWLSGIAVFGLTRELVAYPTVMRLANQSRVGVDS